MVDVLDAVFTDPRLWRDVKHNGVSEPAELHDLPSLGINGVRLNY